MCKIDIRKLGILGVALFGMVFTNLTTRADEFLPVLKVGDDVYKNVTITSVTPTDIYFTCGAMVGNAKLKKLDPELQKHFKFDPARVAAIEKEQREANIAYSVLAGKAPIDKIDASNAKRELDIAIARVKEIVNQPVRQLPAPDDMNGVGYSTSGWFHEGASKPDFKTVDVRRTQEFVYHTQYVTSNLNPGVVFVGDELEFNSMTKYFYVDRSLPKKKLTEEEMLEINRLYRVIAKCQDILGEK